MALSASSSKEPSDEIRGAVGGLWLGRHATQGRSAAKVRAVLRHIRRQRAQKHCSAWCGRDCSC